MNGEMKTDRILELFFRALKGEALSAKKLAEQYQVSSRSISRDITSLKNFLADHRDTLGNAELVYSSRNHCYYLELEHFLSNRELLAITKVLIGSRPFNTTELLDIIRKLKLNTTSKDREQLENIIRRELYHYAPVKSDCASVIDNLWNLTESIHDQRLISISYTKMNRTKVKHTLKPVAVMFSEYYYYLIAFDKEGPKANLPCYYRIDRITELTVHREHFRLTKEQDVDEGLLRNRSQFMWPGKLRRIRFIFSGPSVQAVLDRLPTARIVEKTKEGYLIEAEVYGDGIKLFLRSQGSWVKVLAPEDLVEEFRAEYQLLAKMYET